MTNPAWGYGLATTVVDGAAAGRVLDTWFPAPALGAAPGTQAPHELASATGTHGSTGDRGRAPGRRALRDRPGRAAGRRRRRLPAAAPALAPPGAPREVNLDGIFGVLPNVVWTNVGPCAVEDFERTRLALRRKGPVQVYGVDKFPRMTDYVVPSGVRIADADRVRLGAHLAEGTTVMHEGFVNYNAGTLGASMVEGRISAGVVVGDGSDVGGGASIMGTLSGGGREQITVGRRCLIGANAGIGISLGDDCVVEAGTYITAGAKLTLPDGSTRQGGIAFRPVRAAVLAQQRHRRPRGAPPRRRRSHAQRCPARQRLTDTGPDDTSCPPRADRRGPPRRRGRRRLRRARAVEQREDAAQGRRLHGRGLRPRHQPGGGRVDDGRRGDAAIPARAGRGARPGRRPAGEQAAQPRARRRRSRLGRRAAAAAVAGLGHRGPAQRRAVRHRRVPGRTGQGAELAATRPRRSGPGRADLRRRQRLRPARTGGQSPG